MKMKKIIFLTIFLTIFEISYSQNILTEFKNYSIADGLSQSQANNCFIDNKGFLWISTFDGLNRFDGFDFKIYKNRPNNEQTLSGNIIKEIMLQDLDENLWLISGDKLNKFNPKTERVTRFQIKTNDTTEVNADNFILMFQDSKQNIWLSTIKGIFKYLPQENKFKLYSFDKQDNASISNDTIFSIFEDKDKNLWFASQNGINKYNFETDNFKRYLFSEESKLVCREYLIDKSNNLWIAPSNLKLYKYNKKKDNFDAFSLSNETNPNYRINAICEDNFKNIWVATIKGLYKYNYETNKTEQFYSDKNNLNSLYSDTIPSILIDYKNDIYIGTWNGLNKISFESQKMERIKMDKQNVKILNIYEDKNHNIWMNDLNANFYIYNKLKNNVVTVISFEIPYIISFYEDSKYGTFWFGTFGAGFYKYQPMIQKFENYTAKTDIVNNSDSIPVSGCWGIYEDNQGFVWISTVTDGLVKYDTKTKTYTQFTNTVNCNNCISANWCSKVLQIENTLWIATLRGELNTYDINTEKFDIKLDIKTLPRKINIRTSDIKDFVYDNKNSLWLATDYGLICYDIKNEKYKIYEHIPNNENSIFTDELWGVQIIDNQLWIITAKSIDVMDLSTEKFKRYLHSSKDSTGILGNIALSMKQDEKDKNIIWFATDMGLAKLNRTTNKFEYYTIEDGLPNENIYCILQANNGDLWLSTNKGLSRFDYITHKFENFDKSDGLQEDEFNFGASFKAKDGKLYFGGISGVNAFYPDQLKKDTIPPETVIIKFKIFNKEVEVLPISKIELLDKFKNSDIIRDGKDFYLPQTITYTNEITLSYKEKVISFEFAALHYTAPEKNTYKYMLENFDKDWNYVNNLRFATYTNLPAGEYIFKVTSANTDGVWNEKYTQIRLIITPPYWERWWFRISVILLIISITFVYIKIREKNLILQKQLLEQKVKQRTAEIQQQNEEITAQRDEIEEQKNDIDEKAKILEQANNLLTEKNMEINLQKEEIQTQRDQLEIQNEFVTNQRDKITYQKKQITDSINYASNIQQAVLPKHNLFKSYFNDFFILFKPRDIVSGDFYWFKVVNNITVFAVADCTGHGVPGAFLSMLGITLLNELSQRKDITTAAAMLEELRQEIKNSLQQTGESYEAKDGMDISLCAIDNNTLTLQFAGANNSIYLVRKNQEDETFELTFLKADRQPIGIYIKERDFNNQIIQLQKADRLYLMSDGYSDQFGGANHRKFFSANLKELILSVQTNNMENQKLIIEKIFNNWKGTLEQVDDVLVLGVEI